MFALKNKQIGDVNYFYLKKGIMNYVERLNYQIKFLEVGKEAI